jgi:PAS domain-containing protein
VRSTVSVYVAGGLFWILASNFAVRSLHSGEGVRLGLEAALVLATGVIIYFLVKRAEAIRRSLEERAAALEERFDRAVACFPQGVLVVSGGCLVYANPVALRFFGAMSAAQLMSESVANRAAPELRQVIGELLRLGESHLTPPLAGRWLRMDGSPVAAEFSVAPLDSGADKSVMVFLSATGPRFERPAEPLGRAAANVGQ